MARSKMKRAVMPSLPVKRSKKAIRPEQSEAEKQMRLGTTNLKKFRVLVKPNSKENKILGIDKNKKAIKISIKAPADKNKANLELIKFLSKKLKRKVRIKSGLTSKEKVISIL